jgi:hypothetical protein
MGVHVEDRPGGPARASYGEVMDYQTSVDVEKVARWQVRLAGLAAAHKGQPVEAHLRAIADELYAEVPEEWWASQPAPLDNRIRNG